MTELSDPTPVSGDAASFGYRPPLLRITATYDSPGAGQPTSLDVEIHDEEMPAADTLRQIVADVIGILGNLGKHPNPPHTPVTWTSGVQINGLRYSDGSAAA